MLTLEAKAKEAKAHHAKAEQYADRAEQHAVSCGLVILGSPQVRYAASEDPATSVQGACKAVHPGDIWGCHSGLLGAVVSVRLLRGNLPLLDTRGEVYLLSH